MVRLSLSYGNFMNSGNLQFFPRRFNLFFGDAGSIVHGQKKPGGDNRPARNIERHPLI